MTTTTTTGHKSKQTSKLNKDDCFNAFFLKLVIWWQVVHRIGSWVFQRQEVPIAPGSTTDSQATASKRWLAG
jgi:hypothetical protein